MSASPWSVRRVHTVDDAQIDGLADVLIDCVEGGASVSFMWPLSRERAVTYWRTVARDVAGGGRALVIAEDAQGVCGTVQLVLEQPENQPHRADLAKMLVHRRVRRHGVGAALLRAAEAVARESGKSLLVLDTVTGGDAERLYAHLGWVRVGSIPNYALMPMGGFCSTTYYYRDLENRSRFAAEATPAGEGSLMRGTRLSDPQAGLCADCVHGSRVTSSRGSEFWRCERAAIDPTFPRYPRLPVLECAGCEPLGGLEH